MPKPEALLPPIPFKQARWFTALQPGRRIDLIVLHSMEAPEKGSTAANCAAYLASTSRKASAHFCCDSDEIVRCVRDKDVAYGAPGANHNGLHIEMAGYARQTEADWRDKYSWAMLKIVARLVAVKCYYLHIPPVWLTPAQVAAGSRGITCHADITKAFKRKGGHTDPGKGFPVAAFMKLVAAVYKEFEAPPT